MIRSHAPSKSNTSARKDAATARMRQSDGTDDAGSCVGVSRARLINRRNKRVRT
jgi:hypothetical protein